MNITINLITNLQETVPNTVLTKILTVKRNGGVVNLTGNIYIPAAYVNEILEFCTYFGLTEDENTPGTYRGNNIILSVGTNYINFEDNEIARIINETFGSDGHITALLARNVVFTSSTFLNNTVILTFPEFNLFTKANTNPPNALFKNCTSLTSIDLSNVTTFSGEEFRNTRIPNVTIPSSATTISPNCFSWNTSLTSVTAPDVQVIGNRAFDLCSSLTTFSDFSNVTTIETNAFYSCLSLTGILNAPNLSTLGTGAFFGNSFEGIECIGTLSSIPEDGFGYNGRKNKLTYVYLPYECTTLSNGAFARMTALSTVKQYDKTISAYQEGETKTFLPDLSKITSFGKGCFRECFALPLTGADLVNATNISNECFYLSRLSGALTLSHLTSLGSNAFYACDRITSVDLTGSTITSIPLGCFNSCTALTSVTIPSTVTLIGKEAFLKCTSLVINTLDLSNLISIGARAFSKVGVKSVIWSSTLTEISTGTFSLGGLENISNIDHVTTIKGRCFLGCNLKQVLYLKNVVTTSYYGDDVNGSDNGNTFTGDNVIGSAYGLYMPKTVDIYGGKYPNDAYASGFFGNRGLTIIPVVYFRDLEELYPASFSSLKCQSLIINNVTPPVWYNTLKMQDSEVTDIAQYQKNKVFPANCNITNIYVPDSAVSTYTNDPDWSTLISRSINILSMNNLTHYNTEADWITAGKPATGIIDAYM